MEFLSKWKFQNSNIALAIYNNENQFPYNPFQSQALIKTNLKEDSITFNFTLKPGTYAFSMLDDENDNNDMDYRFGIPKEGYGFSNDAKPNMMGPPDYSKCTLKITNNNHFFITAKYWL